MTSSSPDAILENVSLKPYTTFKIGGRAYYFITVRNAQVLQQALAFQLGKKLSRFVLGGGSNILVSDAGFDGLVIHLGGEGLSVEEESSQSVTLQAQAGETWDRVVGHAVERGWWGIENLSHIPGQAGAALVQNIGAYGGQVSDFFHQAEVMDTWTQTPALLSRDDCKMGYRQTIFNSTAKGRFIILSLTLNLSKQSRPNLQYADVGKYFEERKINQPSLAEIRQAIITIRDAKFPFPREEKGGNAGSFFKNLQLNEEKFRLLELNLHRNFGPKELARLEEIKKRRQTGGEIKVPTAFLMDICGLKGCREGGAQVNETQPLVLLNRGGATAADVLRLARLIRQTVFRQTGMTIELEPELVGFSKSETEDYLSLR